MTYSSSSFVSSFGLKWTAIGSWKFEASFNVLWLDRSSRFESICLENDYLVAPLGYLRLISFIYCSTSANVKFLDILYNHKYYHLRRGVLGFWGKRAAGHLDALPLLGRDFLRVQATFDTSVAPRRPEVGVDELQQAWAAILQRSRLKQHHRITREQLSVRETMSQVLRRLQGRRFVEFHELFDATRGMASVVVTLVATLELSREHLVDVTQAEAFAPIYVRLAYTPS